MSYHPQHRLIGHSISAMAKAHSHQEIQEYYEEKKTLAASLTRIERRTSVIRGFFLFPFFCIKLKTKDIAVSFGVCKQRGSSLTEGQVTKEATCGDSSSRCSTDLIQKQVRRVFLETHCDANVINAEEATTGEGQIHGVH